MWDVVGGWRQVHEIIYHFLLLSLLPTHSEWTFASDGMVAPSSCVCVCVVDISYLRYYVLSPLRLFFDDNRYWDILCLPGRGRERLINSCTCDDMVWKSFGPFPLVRLLDIFHLLIRSRESQPRSEGFNETWPNEFIVSYVHIYICGAWTAQVIAFVTFNYICLHSRPEKALRIFLHLLARFFFLPHCWLRLAWMDKSGEWVSSGLVWIYT